MHVNEILVIAAFAMIFGGIGFAVAWNVLQRRANGEVRVAIEEGEEPYIFLALNESVDSFIKRPFVIVRIKKVNPRE